MLDRVDSSIKARELLIASVSHDLRTPITVVRGQVDVMQMNPSLAGEERERLQMMSRELGRLARMTNNLLLGAQLESGAVFVPMAVDLKGLLEEVVREMNPLAGGITVTDSGPGIAAEFLGEIGQAFYRPPAAPGERKKGIGLGLFIVKRIIALHGGQFRISSGQGGGTVVKMLLPLKARPIPE